MDLQTTHHRGFCCFHVALVINLFGFSVNSKRGQEAILPFQWIVLLVAGEAACYRQMLQEEDMLSSQQMGL